MKVATYTNKVHFPFWWLNYKNFIVKRVLLRAFLVGDLPETSKCMRVRTKHVRKTRVNL